MSSTKNSTSLTLNALILIADKFYADHALGSEVWDFKNSTIRKDAETTALRHYICAELSDTYDPAKLELEQLSTAITAMKMAKDDLDAIQAGMEEYLIWTVVLDFWSWFKQSGRNGFTPGLLNSWIEVHPLELVRLVSSGVRRVVETETPLHLSGQLSGCVSVDPELIQEMDAILKSRLRVMTTEEPNPAAETSPAAPAADAPPPTT